MKVDVSGFTPNSSVTVGCYASNTGSGSWATYTMSINSAGSGSSQVCYYGYPGQQAWVVAGGTQSNKVTW